MTTLTAIEQAKGALMVTYGISADAAFALLRFHSQNRNVNVRAIAAQLTTLMCPAPSSSEAITRFDRLLDDVAVSLQAPAQPTPDKNNAAAAADSPSGAAGWPQIDPAALPQVMLRAARSTVAAEGTAGGAAGRRLHQIDLALIAHGE